MSPAESGTCSGLDKVSDKWGVGGVEPRRRSCSSPLVSASGHACHATDSQTSVSQDFNTTGSVGGRDAEPCRVWERGRDAEGGPEGGARRERVPPAELAACCAGEAERTVKGYRSTQMEISSAVAVSIAPEARR